jgi:ribosome maturation factor RimP
MNWLKTVEDTVAGLGYEAVDCERGSHGLLRVYIDRLPQNSYDQPGEFVTVEDCEKVTRQLQYALEVVNADYARLEVSSPGLDRALKTPAHFERFADTGAEVEISLKQPFQGRRNYQGVLGHFQAPEAPSDEAGAAESANVWQLVFKQGAGKQATEQVLGFNLDEIREARLVPAVDFKGRGRAKPADETPNKSPMNSENTSNEP